MAYIIKLVIFLVYYSLISMFTLHIAVYYYNMGNVNECRTALVKNLIKESFYEKRKKSN